MTRTKTKFVAATAAVLALLLASVPVDAQWTGISRAGLHRGHARHLLGAGPYYGYGGYGGYGGDVAMPSEAADMAVTYVTPILVVEAPPALACHRTEQVVTVPTEEGGARDIKITRC
jgi:hypothetical protein